MYEQNEEFPFKYYGIDGRSVVDKCTALDMQNGIYLYFGQGISWNLQFIYEYIDDSQFI